jgi:hypothetical protein
VAKYLLGEKSLESNMEKLRLDLESDNGKKTKILNIKQGTDNQISMTESQENNFNLIDTKETAFEKILKNEANSLEINNCKNVEISFNEFKGLFFSLPFIPDLLRASCGFNNSLNENLIKNIPCLKLEISHPDIKIFTRNFIFTRVFVTHY